MKKTAVMHLCVPVMIVFLSINALAASFSARVKVLSQKDGHDSITITVENQQQDDYLSAVILNSAGKPKLVEQAIGEGRNVFTLNLYPNDEKDKYYLARVSAVVGNGEIETIEIPFNYYTYREQQDVIARIINPQEPASVIDEIELASVLSLPIDGLYSRLPNKGFVKSKLEGMYFGQTDISLSAFLKSFDEIVLLAALNSKQSSLLSFLTERHAEDLEIADSNEYKWYNGFEKQEKDAVDGKVAAAGAISEIEDFANIFKVEVFLQRLNISHYSNAAELLAAGNGAYKYKNGTNFVLNFSGYEGLTSAQKELFAVEIINAGCQTLEALKDAFNTALINASKFTETPSAGASAGKSASSSLGRVQGAEISANGALGKDTPSALPKFNDIEQVPWAVEAIEALAKQGVISGVGENMFLPDGIITREQFAKIIIGAFGFKPSAGGREFIDVIEGEWHYEFVKTAVSLGIMTGYGDEFGVGDEISRQDMAVVMYRVAIMTGIDLGAKSKRNISDFDSIAAYAQEAADILYKAEFINGTGDGNYSPTANATRAQAAKLIYDLRRAGK